MPKRKDRISKKLRKFIRQAVAGALTVAMRIATGKQVSINPAWVRVSVQSGWYSFGFGNPNDSASFSGAGTVFINAQYTSISVDFWSDLSYHSKQPFKGKRWFNLHRSRSFVMKRGLDGKLAYAPPQEPVVYDRRGRPLDFTTSKPRIVRPKRVKVDALLGHAKRVLATQEAAHSTHVGPLPPLQRVSK